MGENEERQITAENLKTRRHFIAFAVQTKVFLLPTDVFGSEHVLNVFLLDNIKKKYFKKLLFYQISHSGWYQNHYY